MTAQASSYPYCNVTTDLQLVDSEIEKFFPVEALSGWTLTSGQTSTYQYQNPGYVGIVWEDDTELTVKTSIATVEATASTWWYDSTNNLLYVHASNGLDPDTHVIEVAADDWKTYKETQRNNAMEMIESLVDTSFNRPLPFAKNSYNAAKYDYDIMRSCALITCSLIRKAENPLDPVADAFWAEVWSPKDDTGIMWEHVQGKRKFSFETSKDDFDGRLESLVLDTASTGRIYLSGKGDSTQHKLFRVKIDTAGAVETATFKTSDDNGLTWYSLLQKTYYEPQYLARGLWVRFEGTFVVADEWLIEISGNDESVKSNISSIKLVRN